MIRVVAESSTLHDRIARLESLISISKLCGCDRCWLLVVPAQYRIAELKATVLP